MKKYILFFTLWFAIMTYLQAQSVSYTYRPFADEGCFVTYTPSFIGDTAYIVVNIRSDRLVFNDNPIMMVRFFNTNQIIQLTGKKLDATSNDGAILVGNVLVPFSEVKAMAMFKVSEQEMELFKCGVERIRLSTFPITHDRTFHKDKIGIPLYMDYQIAKQKAQNF